ncbi:BTB domain-containing protein [Mycena kentingensis (nom. inval.)]|nr:BTB domain-containing protein [Mycena kentingensis (nom. inval.)]
MSLFSWTPFPFAYLALYLACIFTPLVIDAGRLQRALFFLPVLWLTARLWYDGEIGYLSGMAWFACLPIASDFLLLTDVRGGVDGKPLLERIWWALDLLLTSGRGVGWAHSPRHLRVASNTQPTPAQFILSQTIQVVFLLFINDLAHLHARWNPAYFGTITWAIGAYATLALVHVVASIVAVGSGISEPKYWPPLFGRLADLASVRSFWSRAWHQLFRRGLTVHGRFLATSILHLPPRSFASTCVTMLTAFLLSGLVHFLGEQSPLRRRGYTSGSLIFFGIQPVAIALEAILGVFLQRNPRYLPSPRMQRVLGTLWVVSWFALTFPTMQDPILRAGGA